MRVQKVIRLSERSYEKISANSEGERSIRGLRSVVIPHGQSGVDENTHCVSGVQHLSYISRDWCL